MLTLKHVFEELFDDTGSALTNHVTLRQEDILARNFRTRKSSTIVVLVPDIANPFFSRVIRGIEQTAQRLGYAVLLGDTQGERSREITYANMVKTSQADGIIQLDSHVPFEKNNKHGAPIVNACDCIRDTDNQTKEIDNALAAQKMTEYLISLGHQNIGVITGPINSTITQDRLKGYKQALEEASIDFLFENIKLGDHSIQSGAKATLDLMNNKNPPSAIFCMNDEMAIGAIQAMKAAGISMDDVVVGGVDATSDALVAMAAGEMDVTVFQDLAGQGKCQPLATRDATILCADERIICQIGKARLC